MTYPIAHAVSSSHVATFKQHGIRTTDKLLSLAAEARPRKAIAAKTKIPESQILDFVNAADLMRIKGLGVDYIRLLRAVEVVTVRELKHRNPENLDYAMAVANTKGEPIVSFLPSLHLVRRWIEQAKLLPVKVTYR